MPRILLVLISIRHQGADEHDDAEHCVNDPADSDIEDGNVEDSYREDDIVETNDLENCDLEEDCTVDDDQPASELTQGNDTACDIDENEGLNDLSLPSALWTISDFFGSISSWACCKRVLASCEVYIVSICVKICPHLIWVLF